MGMIPLQLTRIPRTVPAGGLGALDKVALSPPSVWLLTRARAGAQGPLSWVSRKYAETRDVLALGEIADRLTVHDVDMRETLGILATMRVAVPCLEHPDAPLVVKQEALLGIQYPEAAVRSPQPGYAFVQILSPAHVWHASVARERGAQILCLGAVLPAGIRLKEIVLMTYAALCMQAIQIDERDSAGVMNGAAARYWQQRRDSIPLSKAPFLSPREEGV
jgi:hypothetical protein